MRENIKIVVEGIKKLRREDSLLSLTILIVFFQIAVYLTRFVLAIISRVFNQLILVKLFVL